MKRYAIVGLAIVAFCFIGASLAYSDSPTIMSQTGKVTAIDPEGKGIVITVGKGSQALDVGTIVQPDTKLLVKGKSVPVSDIMGDIKVGDTVMLRYARTDDLYAKEIVKK